MTSEVYSKEGELIWIPPSGAYFDLERTEWVLHNMPYIKGEGKWPQYPTDSGYFDNPAKIQVSVSRHAPFEAAEQVAAECDRRLAVVETDRDLVEAFYYVTWPYKQNGFEQLAKARNMTAEDVENIILRAVKYIASGPCPRWLGCGKCGHFTECKRKKRQGTSYKEWKHRGWVRYKKELFNQ